MADFVTQAIHQLNIQIEELQKENQKLRHDIKNHQQIAHLKGYQYNRLLTKYNQLAKDAHHMERAFENYVDRVERENTSEEEAVENVRRLVRQRIDSAS